MTPTKRRRGRKMGKYHERIQILLDTSTRAALEQFTEKVRAASVNSAVRCILRGRLTEEGLLKP